MNIIITYIQSSLDGKLLVAFSSPVGTGLALWNDGQYQPRVGHEYSIELDIEEECLRYSSVVSTTSRKFSLGVESGEVILTGMVDSVDDDGLSYFRLAPSCLIMISPIEDRPMSQDDWLTIRVKADDLLMTSIGQ